MTTVAKRVELTIRAEHQLASDGSVYVKVSVYEGTRVLVDASMDPSHELAALVLSVVDKATHAVLCGKDARTSGMMFPPLSSLGVG